MTNGSDKCIAEATGTTVQRTDNIYMGSNELNTQKVGNSCSNGFSNCTVNNDNSNNNKRLQSEFSEYDVMYIDEKDPDFASPAPKKKSPKRPKGTGAKTFQGTLSVDKKGKMSFHKPVVETASNIESAVKVAPISNNIDGEISSLRETLGNIDEKIAALERLKETTRRELSRKLKQKAQKTAQTTVLDGCERRPLETVIGVVFSARGNVNNGDNTAHCGHSNSNCEHKVTSVSSEFCKEKNPLWELSKLHSNFDVVVNGLETCTKNPVI